MEFKQGDFEKGVKMVKKYITFCQANYTYSGNSDLLERLEQQM